MTKPPDFSKPEGLGLAGTLERITDDVYALVGFQGVTNCGLILTGEGAIVVERRDFRIILISSDVQIQIALRNGVPPVGAD